MTNLRFSKVTQINRVFDSVFPLLDYKTVNRDFKDPEK